MLDLMEYQNAVNNYNKNDFKVLKNTNANKKIYNYLMNKKIIKLNKKGNIQKQNNANIYIAKLQRKTNFGFAIIHEHDDLYISNVKGYLNNDYVLVIKTKESKKSDSAKILGLIYRTEELFMLEKTKKGFICEGTKFDQEIELEKSESKQIKIGTIVAARVKNVSNKYILFSLKEIITDKDDPDKKIKMILGKYNIPLKFNEDIKKEVKKVDQKILSVEMKNRLDLRNQMFFTIDGEDSKDLDDAISLRKEGTNFRLFVSIADVSHYIKESTFLDLEARKRGTSVYFVDKVIPMLPKEISNGICSLHRGVDRLTLTCEMLINGKGKILSNKVYRSVINSKYRLVYSDINKIFENKNQELISKYSEIYGILLEMNKLAKILNKKRVLRGSFNLEDNESKFKIKDNKVIDIYPIKRGESEKLIEEFAIIANESVTKIITEEKIPFIYRIHDLPNKKKIKELQEVLFYLKMSFDLNFENIKPKDLKEIFDEVNDPILKRVISSVLVRSMSKAVYSIDNIGHFGLASKEYTHFTSPIRRYPDLIVHRIIKRYLDQKEEMSSELLAQIAKESSDREVAAIKASGEIEDYEKIKYMNQFKTKIFEGTIVAIEDYGFFVELPNTVRGLIRYPDIIKYKNINKLKIEFYDDITLKFGQKIEVKIFNLNLERGFIDFIPADKKYQIKEEQKNIRRKKNKYKKYGKTNSVSKQYKKNKYSKNKRSKY